MSDTWTGKIKSNPLKAILGGGGLVAAIPFIWWVVQANAGHIHDLSAADQDIFQRLVAVEQQIKTTNEILLPLVMYARTTDKRPYPGSRGVEILGAPPSSPEAPNTGPLWAEEYESKLMIQQEWLENGPDYQAP